MTAELKSNMGPARSHACDSCGEHVSPSRSFFFVLVVVMFSGIAVTLWLAIPAGGGAADQTTAIAGAFVTLAVLFALAYRYADRTPLVLRKAHRYKQV